MQAIKEQLIKSKNILADLIELNLSNAKLLELLQPTIYEESIKNITLWYEIINDDNDLTLFISGFENKSWRSINLNFDLAKTIICDNKYHYCLAFDWNGSSSTVKLSQADYLGIISPDEVRECAYILCDYQFEGYTILPIKIY